MDQTIVMFLLGQAVIIVGAVVVSHVSTKVAITRLQVQGENITRRVMDLKEDHRNLSAKVDGISRHVVRLEEIHLRCPYVAPAKQEN